MNDDFGTVLVGDQQWDFLCKERSVLLLGPLDEDVPAKVVGAAARAVKAALAPARIRPCVRLLPSVRMILGKDLDRDQLIEAFNDLLNRSLRVLGASNEEIEEWCSYGMPSEYRGWLASARKHAMRQMVRTNFGWDCIGDSPEESKTNLASEVVLGTSAVAVSMRHTYATFDISLATAIKGLSSEMGFVDLFPNDELQ